LKKCLEQNIDTFAGNEENARATAARLRTEIQNTHPDFTMRAEGKEAIARVEEAIDLIAEEDLKAIVRIPYEDPNQIVCISKHAGIDCFAPFLVNKTHGTAASTIGGKYIFLPSRSQEAITTSQSALKRNERPIVGVYANIEYKIPAVRLREEVFGALFDNAMERIFNNRQVPGTKDKMLKLDMAIMADFPTEESFLPFGIRIKNFQDLNNNRDLNRAVIVRRLLQDVSVGGWEAIDNYPNVRKYVQEVIIPAAKKQFPDRFESETKKVDDLSTSGEAKAAFLPTLVVNPNKTRKGVRRPDDSSDVVRDVDDDFLRGR
jgi:hypothetical protein